MDIPEIPGLHSNVTDSVTQFHYQTRVEWIVSVSVNAVALTISLWILICMMHYGVKTRKWKQTYKIDAEKLNAGWIYTVAVVCAACAVIRLVTSQVSFHVGYGVGEEYLCEAIFDILYVAYCHMLLFVFLFIWIRQRVFYVNKMLQVDNNKTLKIFSSFSLVFIFMACYTVILIECIPDDTVPSAEGCRFSTNYTQFSIYTWSVSICVLLIVEVILLVLLIHPLLIHLPQQSKMYKLFSFCFKTKEKSLATSFTPVQVKSQSLPISSAPDKRVILVEHFHFNVPVCNTQYCHKPALTRSGKAVKSIMKRTLIFGSLSIASELVIILIMLLPFLDFSDPSSQWITTVVYDVNVLLNLLFVLFSFLSYKEMLTSPFKREFRVIFRSQPYSV